jgi:hypothetical protein
MEGPAQIEERLLLRLFLRRRRMKDIADRHRHSSPAMTKGR